MNFRITLLFLAIGAVAAELPSVPYPEGYRHWTFLHASTVPANFGEFKNTPCEKPCSAGIFYFYANDKAMEGLRTGTYPDGSILAEEMLEFLNDPKTNGKEGKRHTVGVMVKNDKLYAATGGWGYGDFPEGAKTNKLDSAAQTTCSQCHLARKDHGQVFSEWAER